MNNRGGCNKQNTLNKNIKKIKWVNQGIGVPCTLLVTTLFKDLASWVVTPSGCQAVPVGGWLPGRDRNLTLNMQVFGTDVQGTFNLKIEPKCILSGGRDPNEKTA
jgi:hypothetical protein